MDHATDFEVIIGVIVENAGGNRIPPTLESESVL